MLNCDRASIAHRQFAQERKDLFSSHMQSIQKRSGVVMYAVTRWGEDICVWRRSQSLVCCTTLVEYLPGLVQYVRLGCSEGRRVFVRACCLAVPESD